MEFLFSRGIHANQKLYDVFRDRSRKFLLGVQESVRNSIAELLMNPFDVHKVCFGTILGIL